MKTRFQRTWPVTGLLFALLAFGSGAAHAIEIAVVVSPTSELSSLTPEQVKAIFLGKTATLPSGKPAEPVAQAEARRVTEVFDRHLLEKTPDQLEAYWAQRIFSGKGSPPMVVADDAAVKNFVNTNLDSVGYIDSANVDNSVKVVLRIAE